MSRMIRRIIIFYIFTFVFTIILGGAQEAAGISGILILPQLAPGIGALLMVLIFRKEGFHFQFRGVPRRRITAAVLVPFGAAVIIYVLNSFVFRIGDPAPLSEIPWLMILWMPFGALGEELGWRGYLQRIIGERMTPLYGAVITGILWAGWHVGMYANGTSYFLFFLVMMISYSIVMGFLCGREMNVIPAAVFHFMINLTNLFSLSSISSLQFIIVSSLVWAVPAAVILLRKQPDGE